MANVPTLFFRGLITTTTVGVVATVPAGKKWVVTNIIAANVHSAARTTTIQLDGVTLLQSLNLGVGGQYTLDCTQVLVAGDTIGASSSTASGITLHVSGVEVS